MKLQLFVALLAGLALEGNARVVSKEKRDITKREEDIMVEDCNTDYPGSLCIRGCPRRNRVNGQCEIGTCCKPATDDLSCSSSGGACSDSSQCAAPKYDLTYRCSGGKICCFEPGNLCGTMPDNTTATCMVDCPEHHAMPGSCDVGVCCRPPKDDRECNAEFGNCVHASECKGYQKYSRPARCTRPGYVCCFDPRFEVTAYWDTCYTREIRVHFCCLARTVIYVRCKVVRLSTGDILIDLTLQLNAYVKLLSKVFEVPSCMEDYLLKWEIVGHVEYRGQIEILRCNSGMGWRDPHMLTFGGTKYNFNGHCSYTLAKDCSSQIPTFDISAAFRGRYHLEEAPTRMVSVSTTVNGQDTYTFLEDLTVLLNGWPIKQNELTIGGLGHIGIEDDRVSLYLKKHAVSLEWIGKDHEAVVSIGDEDLNGKLCGILGDGTKEKGHDLLKSDGSKTFNTTEFAESWLIPGSCPP